MSVPGASKGGAKTRHQSGTKLGELVGPGKEFVLSGVHIVSSKKFLRISSSPHQTLPTDNYNAPEEVGGGRKLFHRPLKK